MTSLPFAYNICTGALGVINKLYHIVLDALVFCIPSYATSIVFVDVEENKVSRLAPFMWPLKSRVVTLEPNRFYAITFWSRQTRRTEYVFVKSYKLFLANYNLDTLLRYLTNESYHTIFYIEIGNKTGIPAAQFLDKCRVSLAVPHNITAEAVVCLNSFVYGIETNRSYNSGIKVSVYDFNMNKTAVLGSQYLKVLASCDDVD